MNRILIKSMRSLYFISAAISVLAFPAASLAQDEFHATFGTTGESGWLFSDGVSLIAETDRGDIVVAGAGASSWTDTGGGTNYPMIARFSSRGELRWQRIYRDLAHSRLIAIVPSGEEQYVLLEQPHPNDLSVGPIRLRTIALRRVALDGELSVAIATVDGLQVSGAIPIVDADEKGFVLQARRGRTIEEIVQSQLLLRLDLQGNLTELAMPDGIGTLGHVLHMGGDEFLLAYQHGGHDPIANERPFNGLHSLVVQFNLSGGSQERIHLVDRLCGPVIASDEKIVCALFPPMRSNNTSDSIAAYSKEGAELWSHNLEPRSSVYHMALTGSEDLLASYNDEVGATVLTMFSSSGEVLWTQPLRSTGEYTFLTNVELLSADRLAYLGSTGPFGGFASTDTNAILVVARPENENLSALDISSTIVASP